MKFIKSSIGSWPPSPKNKEDNIENTEKDFEKIKEEFSEWSKKHLREIYENQDYINLVYETPVEKWIGAKLSLDSKKLLENNNKQIQDLIKVFLDELYIFSISLLSKRSDEDKEQEEIFLYNLDNLYVNQEPDLTSFLPIEQQVIFAGKTNKISFLSNDFGSDINLRIINTPELISNSDKIIEEISKIDIDEKVDTLENLAKIALEYEFTSYGNDIWETNEILNYPTTDFSLKMKSIIYKVVEREKSPIVKELGEKFLKRIGERGLEGLKIDNFFKKDISLKYPDEITRASTVVEVSKDFVGIYDMGNIVPSVILDQNNKIVRYEDLYQRQVVLDKNLDSDLVRFLHRPEIFMFVEQEFNLDLREITLQDQIHFMNFLAGENQETFDRLKKLFEKEEIQNENLLKTFLSTSGDLKFGENILKIGEKYPAEISNQIFKKYAEIIGVIDNMEDIIRENVSDDVDSSLVEKNIQALLKNSKRWLKEMVNVKEIDVEEFDKKVNSKISEHTILGESYRELLRSKKITNLDDLKEVEQRVYSGQEILSDESLLEQVKNIYIENTQDISQAYAESRVKKFLENLKTDRFEVKLVKFKNEIMSFLGIKKWKEEGRDFVELSAYNANKEFCDISGAVNILNKILADYERQGCVIQADATLENARVYIQKFGFVGKGVEEIENNLNILIEKNKDLDLKTLDKKQYNRQFIIDKIHNSIFKEENIKYFYTQNVAEIPETDNGYILTQAFKTKDGYYYVLEKTTSE